MTIKKLMFYFILAVILLLFCLIFYTQIVKAEETCPSATPTDIQVTKQQFTSTPKATKTLPNTWTPDPTVTSGGPPTETDPVPSTRVVGMSVGDVSLPVSGYGKPAQEFELLIDYLIGIGLIFVVLLIGYVIVFRRKK